MESPAKEHADAPNGPGSIPRPRLQPSLVVLEFSGDDAETWLSGQVTNDLKRATDGAAAYALFVTVRGKIMADAWLSPSGTGSWLAAVPRESLPALRESFDKFIIMEDVTVTEREDVILSIPTEGAPAELTALAATHPHWRSERDGEAMVDILLPPGVSLPATADAGPQDELARLQRAAPRFGADFDQRHYPQEAGLKERAVSFNKGCYLGQEVVCTLESRGHIVKRLVQLRGKGDVPAANTPLLNAEGTDVGYVTSSALDPATGEVFALGYAKRAAAEPGTALTAAAASLTVIRPTN